MKEKTEYLGLIKDSDEEFYSVNVTNNNLDKIDAGFGEIQNSLTDLTPEDIGALPISEKDASVPDSIANQIAKKQDSDTAITTDNISSQRVNYANTAGSVAWDAITGKPSTYTPATHASTEAAYGAGSKINYGHVKLSDSSAVTDTTGLALAATEKNASIAGTLANQIAEQNTKLQTLETGTVTWNIHASNNTAACYKFGKVVTLAFNFNTTQVMNDNVTLFTLPAGFRPAVAIPFPFIKAGAGVVYNAVLDVNGAVYTPNNELEMAWYCGTVTFTSGN